MEKLIAKGGFRERANRYKKFQNSENQQTKLIQHSYNKTPTEQPLEINPSSCIEDTHATEQP